jgi:uncharacterized membrane protein YvbJ
MSIDIVTKEELKLLLESHRDNIELNTKLIFKLDSLIEYQKSNCQNIDKLCEKLDQQTNTLIHSNTNLSKELVNMKTEDIREFSSIRNRLYVSFTMMGTIILALITIIAEIFTQ